MIFTEGVARLGSVLGLEIVGVGRTVAGDFDDDGVGISPGEMIVAGRFRVHASWRKRLQRLFKHSMGGVTPTVERCETVNGVGLNGGVNGE